MTSILTYVVKSCISVVLLIIKYSIDSDFCLYHITMVLGKHTLQANAFCVSPPVPNW